MSPVRTPAKIATSVTLLGSCKCLNLSTPDDVRDLEKGEGLPLNPDISQTSDVPKSDLIPTCD